MGLVGLGFFSWGGVGVLFCLVWLTKYSYILLYFGFIRWFVYLKLVLGIFFLTH